MAYKFLDAPAHPDGPAAELKEFLDQYRAQRSQSLQETPQGPVEATDGQAPQDAAEGPRTAHSDALRWEPGTPGKGLILNGQPHTWPVDSQYTPSHAEYMNQLGLLKDDPYELRPDWSQTQGPYVVINSGGDIHPATVNEGEDISPYLKADPRLKPPIVHQGESTIDDLSDEDWDNFSQGA